MKVLHLNHSDILGGAARAAYRIHHALRQQGVDSTMLVNVANSGDWTVDGPETKLTKVAGRVRGFIGGLPKYLLRTGNPIIHSLAVFPSGLPKRLNKSHADVLHLHWVNGEMLSISDIGKLRKPIVWTLHDMWAFCGAEHYTEDFRWRDGYLKGNRPGYENGFDLNRWTWGRKRNLWTRPLHIVTPSRWLAECVRQSALMCDWPVSVVPNAINTDVWRPVDRRLARQLLQLPQDVPLLLFGAIGGGNDPRKGFDLLAAALNHLRGEVPGLELVIFGQLAPKVSPELGFPIHYAGHLHDDISLRLLYSAVNAMAIPSRQDNLPNTGIEAHACGTPVVAFDIGGLSDIVENQKTGYLAKAFDAVDFARGILWTISDPTRHSVLSACARDRAVRCWDNKIVGHQYAQLYTNELRHGQNS